MLLQYYHIAHLLIHEDSSELISFLKHFTAYCSEELWSKVNIKTISKNCLSCYPVIKTNIKTYVEHTAIPPNSLEIYIERLLNKSSLTRGSMSTKYRCLSVLCKMFSNFPRAHLTHSSLCFAKDFLLLCNFQINLCQYPDLYPSNVSDENFYR